MQIIVLINKILIAFCQLLKGYETNSYQGQVTRERDQRI